MKKKIGDLTLREVAKVCGKYETCSDGCPFYCEKIQGYGICKASFIEKELEDEVDYTYQID